MPALYTVTSQVPSVLITDKNVALDVVEIGFETHPHGVFGQTPVPASTYQALGATTAILDYVEPLAMGIEQVMGLPGVTGARFEQDFDTSTGLLDDFMIFTVSAPDATPLVGTSNSVEVPIKTSYLQEDKFYANHVGGPIGNAYANVTGVLAA